MMPSRESRTAFLVLVSEGYSAKHAAELVAVQYVGEPAWAKDGAPWLFCENTAFACALSAAIAEAGRRPKLSVIDGAAEHVDQATLAAKMHLLKAMQNAKAGMVVRRTTAELEAGTPGFTPPADSWLTCTEAARELGLHRRTVQNQARLLAADPARRGQVDERIAAARRTPGGHWRVRLASKRRAKRGGPASWSAPPASS